MREDTLAVWLECPHGAVHLHGPGAADSLSYTSTTTTSTTQVATQAGCQTLCDSGAGADGDDYADAVTVSIVASMMTTSTFATTRGCG